jgi:hypothetical protein
METGKRHGINYGMGCEGHVYLRLTLDEMNRLREIFIGREFREFIQEQIENAANRAYDDGFEDGYDTGYADGYMKAKKEADV